MAKPARELPQMHRQSEPPKIQLKQRQQVAVTAVSGRKLAAHLDLSIQRITQLTNIEHVITKLPNGKYDQDECRVCYLRWLRDPERRSARSKVDAEFIAAKTELITIRVREKKRDLVEMEEAQAVMEKMVSTTIVTMGGMAARIGGHDMALRRKVDQVVFETRVQLANLYQQFADEAGEPPFKDGRYITTEIAEEDGKPSTNDG